MNGDRTVRPTALGPYEIRTSLGHGGGGEVYRAWDPRLQREVALKILRQHLGADPDRVRRFVFEARAASALNHPNIVTVFDAAVEGSSPYIVSELVDGTTLREEMRRGPLPLRRVVDLATQIAEGLSAAHDAGIVHRDLKPENIMVTRTARAKILDFGLAQPGGVTVADVGSGLGDIETETELGLRAGTVPYMSPEQARGSPSDFRSDQFSFGLIVYEMIASRRPFQRSTPAATLDAIMNDDLPTRSARDPKMPLALRWIVERCLAKDPGDRYSSTADLHRDLRTLRDRLPDAVAREAEGAPTRTASVWTRLAAVLAIAAALAAGVLLAGALREPEIDGGAALTWTPLTTAPGYEGMPAWSPNSNTVAFAAEVDGVLQIFQRDPQAPSASQVTESAFDCKYPFWSPDGRRIYYVSLAQNQEAIWSVLAGGGKPQVVIRNAARGAISPDGKTLAFFRDEGQSNLVGSQALYLATPPGEAPWSNEVVEAAAAKYLPFQGRRFVEGALAFSPDGRRLGISAVGDWLNPDSRWWQFWLAPIPSGEPLRRFEALNSDIAPRVSNFAWLPDNRHVVLGLISLSSSTSHLWMGDVDGDRAWTLASTPVSEEYPSVRSIGDDVEIVYTKDDSDYDLVEVPLDGHPPQPILQTSRKESDPAWSPDGLLAYVTDRSGQDEIWLRDRDGRLADRPLIAQRNFGDDDRTVLLDSPSFSPDGQRIAYLRTGKNPVRPLRIWYSAFAGGTASPLLPMNHLAYHGAPSWSPDGQWIAFAEYSEGKWRLVKVRVGSEERIELRADGVPTATPKWSPTSEWLTWETADGFVLVSPDGTKQQQLSDVQWHAHTWSRDGRSIIGIRETDDYRLSLETMEARGGGRLRVLADLGLSPPANNPVRGLCLSADGRRLVTSLLRMRGDLWLLKGVRWQTERRWLAWLAPGNRQIP